MAGTQQSSRRSKRTASSRAKISPNPPKTGKKQEATSAKAKEATGTETPHVSSSHKTTQETAQAPPSVSQDSTTSSNLHEGSVASSAASTATHRRHSEPLLQQQRHRRRKDTTPAASSWKELPSAKVLSASFVKKYTSQDDLLKRFRHVLITIQKISRDEDLESEGPDQKWPALGGLAHYIHHTFLRHSNSTIRLWTAAICLETLAIYAPDIPWQTPDLKLVWSEVLHQIATLGSDQRNETHNRLLIRMINLLAQVQMGALLVEMEENEKIAMNTTALDDEDEENQKGNTSDLDFDDDTQFTKTTTDSQNQNHNTTSAVELLSQFVSTLLHAIRAKPELHDMILYAITPVLQEYTDDNRVAIPVLDELLMAMLPGPTVQVPKYSTTQHGAPPVWTTEVNQVFRVTASVLRVNASVLQLPVSSLVQRLLTKAIKGIDDGISAQSQIGTELPDIVSQEGGKQPPHFDTRDTSVFSIVPLLFQLEGTLTSTSAGTLNHSLLNTSVFSLLQDGLDHYDAPIRRASCTTVAECLKQSADKNQLLLDPWVARYQDVSVDIRVSVAERLPVIMFQCLASTSDIAFNKLTNAMEGMICDPEYTVRRTALKAVCKDFLKKIASDQSLLPKHAESVNNLVLTLIGMRGTEQQDALIELARIWTRASWGSLAKTFDSSDMDDEEHDLFAGLLLQKLRFMDETLVLTPRKGRSRAAQEESSAFLDWIMTRLFQMAVRGSRNISTNARTKRINPLPALEHTLDQAWHKMIQSRAEENAKRNLSRAASVIFWHKIPRHFGALWGEPRAKRQKILREYLDIRSKASKAEFGSEEAITENAKAFDQLKMLYFSMSTAEEADETEMREDQKEILEKFHQFRDKRFLKALSSIASPTHDTIARRQALEAAKRCKSFLNHTGVPEFAMSLVEQTAMPDWMNQSIISEMVTIAHDYPDLREQTLQIVSVMSEAFPEIVSPAWGPLTEMLDDDTDFEMEEELVDLILKILSSAARFTDSKAAPPSRLTDFMKEGTVEQAKAAARVFVGYHEGDDEDDVATLIDDLTSLLSHQKKRQSVTIVASLTSLLSCAPKNWTMIRDATDECFDFCLKATKKDVSVGSPSPMKKRNRSRSPRENTQISLVCQCIEFLVACIRSRILTGDKSFVNDKSRHIRQIFDRLGDLSQTDDVSEEIQKQAAVHFLQLCDSRLLLEKHFVSTQMWSDFCRLFLETSAVQETLVEEFRSFITGADVYCERVPSMAPALRWIVPYMYTDLKSEACQCIGKLRLAATNTRDQMRAMGKRFEEKYEKVYKYMLLPEYGVFHAIYHLAVASDVSLEEKTLRKKLKSLFAPLISNTDGENIGLLIKMLQLINGMELVDAKEITPLKTIAKIAHEVLMSSAKTDRQLDLNYNAQLNFPSFLFRKIKKDNKTPSLRNLLSPGGLGLSPIAKMDTPEQIPDHRPMKSILTGPSEHDSPMDQDVGSPLATPMAKENTRNASREKKRKSDEHPSRGSRRGLRARHS